jgi:hypothetical protein
VVEYRGMESFGIRTISQLGIYATFVLYCVWTMGKTSRRQTIVLVGAVIYALLFEHFNMARYEGMRGGYHYHPASWLMLWGDVPLYIPLAWGFILSTSMRVTDRLPLAAWARPFSDALLALLLDLSLDVVAIRLNFWYWHDVGLNDAFFGVPADNFLGWLLVTFTFSLLTRLLWKKGKAEKRKQGTGNRKLPQRPNHPMKKSNILLPVPCSLSPVSSSSDAERFLSPVLLAGLQWVVIPPAAYWLYLRLEAVGHGMYRAAGVTNLREQLNVLAIILLAFCIVVVCGMRRQERGSFSNDSAFDRFTLIFPRVIFHLFGVIGLFFIPPQTRSIGIILVTVGIAVVESTVTHFAHAGKTVSG